MGAFQFVVVCALRTAQLLRGCPPRVEGSGKRSTIAQREVALGRVAPLSSAPAHEGDPGVSPSEETAVLNSST
jgi:hypothetical protein